MRFRKDLRLGGTILGLIALALFIPVSQVFACEYKLEFGDTSTGAGQLSLPRDVAVDPSGNVWVADTGHKRVQKFNSSGEFVSQFGLTSLTGVNGITTDASGNVLVATATKIRKYKSNGELLSEFGSEGTGNGQFKSAQDLAVDASGSIWVVDKGSAGTAVRVQKFNSSGVYQSQFGKEGTGNGEFKLPEAIAVDSEGNLLVADTGNNRYQEFNSAGEFVRKVGSAGTGNGQFESPRGIAVDSEGRVWVADSGNSRIQRFSSKGSYQAQIGIYGPNPGEFIEPRGIAISGSNLWVADTGNNRGQKFNLTPEFLLDFGDEASGPGRLSAPRDVAIDAGGNAWVADTGHKRVQKFNSSGEFVSQFGISAGVTAIDVDSKGDIWTLSTTKVRRFKPNGEKLLEFGSEGTGNGQFSSAKDLVIDASDNVWVVELNGSGLEEIHGLGKSRVQKFNSSGVYQSQFGKEGTGNGEFKSPEAIAIDSEGNILVADTGNNRYQEFNSAGEFVRKVGTAGSGNGQFSSPRGIEVDSEGRVWVSDTGNNRLQRFSSKGAYQTQFGSYGPNDGQFIEPRGIAISGSNLWVADTGNNRVQKLNCP